ncbi:hypothetical protein [Tychonema sp. LEGE 06208]|uniref:hypothetical protein n=1 Tax=Tychonema sp. LEGE 06208 TaxID=1828663 RepID=UPI001882842D|nr:hypothetical protein [Tychonema sp. LEGE 06208]MBE9164588.1 hypothetical protein [Tychonema sp. LEGE 06208]
MTLAIPSIPSRRGGRKLVQARFQPPDSIAPENTIERAQLTDSLQLGQKKPGILEDTGFL